MNEQIRNLFLTAFPVINEKINYMAKNGFDGKDREIQNVIKSTADRTKAILPLFDSVLQDAANHLEIDYDFVDARGYDIIFNKKRIEQKLTGSQSGTSFTGAAHQDESKFEADGFWLMRYSLDGARNRIDGFALWETPGLKKLEKTAKTLIEAGQKTRDNGKSTFNTIKVHRDNYDDINCVFGGKIKKTVWVSQTLEKIKY